MMMCSEDMKVALATGHVPIQNVSSALSSDKIYNKTELLINTLKRDFGMEKPKIAVLGIQPHAGDEGTIGMEDEEITKPAIEKLKNSGYLVYGPYASDGFFGQLDHRKFDAVMACYHDQGLIPFKMASFGYGVNMTCGLSIIRTSPDHGTGYDIVGKNIADEQSFLHAYFMAIDAFRHRSKFDLSHEHPIKKGLNPVESSDDVIHD
jgi:4-hydroxythreonine-4-phosphate dehydrogenase